MQSSCSTQSHTPASAEWRNGCNSGTLTSGYDFRSAQAQDEPRLEAKQQAIACLRRHLRARSKWYDNIPGVLWAAYLLVFLCWCVLTLLNPNFTISPAQQSPTHPITGMLMVGLAPLLLCMLALTGYGSALAARTSRLRDNMSLAAICNAFLEHARSMESQDDMFPALTTLLRGVEAADADAITPSAQTSLLNLLRRQHAREPQFTLAALQTLEHIGNEWALPIVARIVVSSDVAEIGQAAHRCMGIIQGRLRDRQAETVLLRPSEDAAAVLLRPASGLNEPDTRLLLRSAQK